MNIAVDVAIVGGGIAGSSLAIQLARKGWSTLLLDQQSFPRHKACGEFLSPESKQMLTSLGLENLDQILKPVPIQQAKLVFQDGASVDMPLPGEAWGISRYALDVQLHEAAMEAGADIREHSKVVAIRPEAGEFSNGYRLDFQTRGEQVSIHARTVFAAWGSRRQPQLLPSVRRSANERMTRRSKAQVKTGGYVGVKSHYEGISVGNAVELYFCEGGYVGLAPVEQGRVNVAALLELRTVQKWGSSVHDILAAASKTNVALAERLQRAVPVEGTAVAQAPVHMTTRPDPWGIVPHIGDAAMVIPPLCGDGMSIALRSALRAGNIAGDYLAGRLSAEEWKGKHILQMDQEFSGLLRRGAWLQTACRMPGMLKLFPGAVRLFPPLRRMLVNATRLKETGLPI